MEDIKPEVIFDELPPHHSNVFFSDLFDSHCINNMLLNQRSPVLPLEVKSIKKYHQNYDVKIVPVDIDIRERMSKYQQEILFMFSTFFKNEDYKMLDAESDAIVAQEGFQFLNSSKFLEIVEKKQLMEKKIIESEIEKDRLLKMYIIFHAEQYDNRENAMLQNIYNYSKENQYNQAVFLIGAGHKRSIVQKIKEYQRFSEIKLNWTLYENE